MVHTNDALAHRALRCGGEFQLFDAIAPQVEPTAGNPSVSNDVPQDVTRRANHLLFELYSSTMSDGRYSHPKRSRSRRCPATVCRLRSMERLFHNHRLLGANVQVAFEYVRQVLDGYTKSKARVAVDLEPNLKGAPEETAHLEFVAVQILMSLDCCDEWSNQRDTLSESKEPLAAAHCRAV